MDRLKKLRDVLGLLNNGKQIVIGENGDIYDTLVIQNNILSLSLKDFSTIEVLDPVDGKTKTVRRFAGSTALRLDVAKLMSQGSSADNPLCNLILYTKSDTGVYISTCNSLYYVFADVFEVPKEGATFVHYKTDSVYAVRCISKAGNKEDNTIYVTYCSMLGQEHYTRTLYDFLALTDERTQRFMEI